MKNLNPEEQGYFGLSEQKSLDTERFEQLLDEHELETKDFRSLHEEDKSRESTYLKTKTPTKSIDKESGQKSLTIAPLGPLEAKSLESLQEESNGTNYLPRLLEVGKKFNVGKETINEFLLASGFAIESNKNYKLSLKMLNAVQIRFGHYQDENIRQINLADYSNDFRKLEQEKKLENQKINFEKNMQRREPPPLFKSDEIIHFDRKD